MFFLDDVPPIGDHMPYIGTVPRFFNPKEPKYYDQVVHEYILSRGEDPAVYQHYDVVPKRLRDAYISARRYDRPPDPLSPKVKALYDVAFDWISREFTPFLGGSRVMSYDEVTEWLHPMKSPGLPWTQLYPFKCDYWMSPHSGFYVKYWDVLATPDYIKSLCSVSIKEEVRPRHKIDVGAIRTIVAMDTNHVQAHLQMYLHQNQRLVDSCGQHSMCLGLDLLRGGANRLVTRMSVHGPKSCVEADGVKFDAAKRSYQLRKVEELRWGWLAAEWKTPENRQRSRNLYEELCTAPLVMPDGHVFGRDGGNPSGQGATTPDNGFMNIADWMVIYMLLTPPEYHTFECFQAFIKLCVCGDDINVAIARVLQEYITPKRIREIAAPQIGMEYTFGSEELQDFADLSFLGHSFKATTVPNLGHKMFLPHIDCTRMRSNMLVDNSSQTLEMTIIRACGLRNETFACESCREWFSSLLNFLRDRDAKIGPSVETKAAWRNFLPDETLWKLYTGVDRSGDRVAQASVGSFEQVAVKTARGKPKIQKTRSPPLIALIKTLLLLLAVLLPTVPVAVTTSVCVSQTYVGKPQLTLASMGKKTEKKTKRKLKKAKAKERAAEAKKVVIMPVVTGKGDYKVNQFSKLRGKGDYFSDLGGNLLGGLGRAIGSGLGGLAGTALKSITGMGDYRVKGAKSNSLSRLYQSGSGTPFQMSEVGAQFAGGPPRVQHREFIGSVVSPAVPGDFATTVYYIQPGLRGQGTLFPWAASIASCFEQYRLHGMILEYVSTSADYAATSGLGQVALSTVYDAGASPLASLSEILNNEWTTTAKPAVSFVHPIECASADNQVSLRFVRSGNTVSDADARLDDVGIFQVTTFGLSATAGTMIGELWATYDIEFYKPVLPDVRAGTTWHATNAISSGAGGVYPWNSSTGLVISSGSSLPIVCSTTVNSSIVMPAQFGGHYMVLFFVGVSGGATVTPGTWAPAAGTTTITGLNLLSGTSGTDTSSSAVMAGVGLGASVYVFSFDGSKDTTLTLAPMTVSVTAQAYINVWVLPLDNDIVTAEAQLERELNALFKGGRGSTLRGLLKASAKSSASSSAPPPVALTIGNPSGRMDTTMQDLPAAFEQLGESASQVEPGPVSRRESDAQVDLEIAALRQFSPEALRSMLGAVKLGK